MTNSDVVTHTPIGYVKSQFTENTPSDELQQHSIELVIKPEFADGLLGLSEGMDVLVLFAFHTLDRSQVALQLHPHHNPENPKRGVFATRTQFRPNPVGATVARIIAINDHTLTMTALDALDGTPILDIKPYLPHFDAEPKHPGSDIRVVKSLEEARHLIDLIDTEVIRLLGKRAKYVHQVVQFKKNATEIRAEKRYNQVMKHRREMAQAAGLNPDVIEQMYVILVENFIKEEMVMLQERLGEGV